MNNTQLLVYVPVPNLYRELTEKKRFFFNVQILKQNLIIILKRSLRRKFRRKLKYERHLKHPILTCKSFQTFCF